MARGFTQYKTNHRVGASPQENEILAFSMANTQLAKAETEPARINALYNNQQLWSVLVKDVALSSNQLPDPLKQQITELGVWAMRYSTQAIANKWPVEPLVEVNRNMIEGLRAQLAIAAKATPPASTSAGLAPMAV
jgi:flagellar protein FlaF